MPVVTNAITKHAARARSRDELFRGDAHMIAAAAISKQAADGSGTFNEDNIAVNAPAPLAAS